MPGFTEELRIGAASTTVFNVLADARNEVQWNEGVSHAALVTDEPIRQGSQFVVEDKRGQHDVEITLVHGASLSLHRRGEDPIIISYERTRHIDIICPRNLARVRFGGQDNAKFLERPKTQAPPQSEAEPQPERPVSVPAGA